MSTLNKISLDGTVYDIGGSTFFAGPTSSDNPFVLEGHAPGIYVFENSMPYIKRLNTDTGYWRNPLEDCRINLIATPTSLTQDGTILFTYLNGEHGNVPTIGSSDISASGYGGLASYGSMSSVRTITYLQGNQTVSGKKTFTTLPESSVVPTTDNQLVNKKYVDGRTLPYEDNGYYVKPTKWTVVSALPTEAIDETTLYIVAPDYEERTVSTTVTSNGFNSGVDWSHITNNFIKVGTTADPDIVESWQNTAENTGMYTTNWNVRTPKYNVNIACSPVFTNTYNEDLYLHGTVSIRDSRGYLRYTAYVNVDENLQSGQLCYYDEDDEETYSTPISFDVNCPIGFDYTIGTNGGLACLKGDTPVKIKDGKTKAIKSIKVGDTVIGADGKETKVIKLYNHKVPVTFNITLSNDDILVASDCHKFSIKGHYRYACQIVKDHKLDRVDGSTFDVLATEVKEEETEVYEILTESGTYTLGNGIICECEAI